MPTHCSCADEELRPFSRLPVTITASLSQPFSRFHQMATLRASPIVAILSVLVFQSSADWVRYKFRHRPECRDTWPRRSENLPPVVLTGVVESLFLSSTGESVANSALVHVKWVHKGPETLEGTRITVNGLGQTDPCSDNVSKSDTLILLLQPMSNPAEYNLNSSAIRVNLNNFERIQALIADRPWRRRNEIADLTCEAHYCPFNAECFASNGVAHCRCIEFCASNYEPVCGSNGETFVNECRFRADSCARQLNLFIRHIGPCGARARVLRSALADFL